MKILNRQSRDILKAAIGVTAQWGGSAIKPIGPIMPESRLEISWRKFLVRGIGKQA